jgi:hypothetical protein
MSIVIDILIFIHISIVIGISIRRLLSIYRYVDCYRYIWKGVGQCIDMLKDRQVDVSVGRRLIYQCHYIDTSMC